MFRLTDQPIVTESLHGTLADPACGAFVCFEGRVRNQHEGEQVIRLEYEAYPKLALAEGHRILHSLKAEHGLSAIICVHRVGVLQVGDVAVWVGASSAHRRECFEAVSGAMSRIKHRLPIWKHEFYADGRDAWVLCTHGATAG